MKEDLMTSAVYTVTGMTCGCCVGSVKGELGKVPGITDVAVDLDSGQVTVTSEAPVEAEAVHGAVAAAGYEVTA
jgi:copper chaperone CopZ